MARVKDLTKPQQRIWRLARAYAKHELLFANVEEAYRSSGDPSDMEWATGRRQRAASRLFKAIQTAHITE